MYLIANLLSDRISTFSIITGKCVGFEHQSLFEGVRKYFCLCEKSSMKLPQVMTLESGSGSLLDVPGWSTKCF